MEIYDWTNISYLQSGNTRQKAAYNILTEINIFPVLKGFDPILVGTIPIEIDILSSDLDIICNALDLKVFQGIITQRFGEYQDFSDWFNNDAYIANFRYKNFELEIYGRSQPTILQNGYKHMLIESRILALTDKRFKQAIIELKETGYKTEPAFGKLLGLVEPYSELLELEKFSNDELKHFISNRYKTT